jgi:hypothetical protein
MWWAFALRTGLLPRIAKRLLTAAEAAELRAYYARFPFDDESNHWLPHGMLQAEVHNKFAGPGGQVAAINFMPFAKRDVSEDTGKFIQDNWNSW